MLGTSWRTVFETGCTNNGDRRGKLVRELAVVTLLIVVSARGGR